LTLVSKRGRSVQANKHGLALDMPSAYNLLAHAAMTGYQKSNLHPVEEIAAKIQMSPLYFQKPDDYVPAGSEKRTIPT
jgi:hypothetical protein